MIDQIGRIRVIDTNVDDIETVTAAPEIIENIFDINMGYWTEVDVPGRVTIDYTDERIEIVDLDNDEDVYVYKATDGYVNDFILDFEFQVLSTAVAGSIFGIGLADGLGTMEDINNGLYARIAFIGANDTNVQIQHMTNGSPANSGSIASLLDDTTYYGRLIRRGSYCWLGIYSDRVRETHMTGSPVEYKDVTPYSFTHLYPMAAYDDGGVGKAMDAYVEAIKLISAADIDKYLRPGEGGINSIMHAVSDVVIYPVAEHAATTVIANDGTSPAFYADTESGTATVVGTPNVHWSEDIDFEQNGTINVISIFAELRWEHKTSGGTAYSKVQMSRDGGANWVDMTDAIAETNVAYQNKTRIGVGRFVTTIVAGANQLEFRLISWEAGGATSSAKIRSDSYVRITTRKS